MAQLFSTSTLQFALSIFSRCDATNLTHIVNPVISSISLIQWLDKR